MLQSTTGSSRATAGTHRWTVRAHLALILTAAVVLVAGALGYGYVWSSDQAQEEAIERMSAQALIGAQEIDATLTEGLAQVDAVAGQPGLEAVLASPEGCSLLVGGSEAFSTARLGILDPAGREVCTSAPGLTDPGAPTHGESAWFRHALDASRSAVAWPATDAVTGEPAVVLARSFPGADGAPAGVVALLLDAGSVASSLATSQAMPDDSAVAVVDRATGDAVSVSDTGLTASGAALFRDRGPAGRWAGADGVERVFGSADTGALSWRIYAGLDHPSVTAAARGTLTRQALAAVAALVLLLLALAVLERRVAGPLAALTRGAVRARDDAGADRVPEAGTAELAALARAFNSMLDIRSGQEARLAYGASHDRLTGLPNQDAFRTRLDADLAAGSQPGGVVTLCVGLNRFQAVSDGVGPEGAQRVLVEVASRLRTTLRPDDTLARGDGHEFLLRCDDLAPHDAIELAERIHLAVEEPMGWPAAGVAMQASTGIAVAGRETVAEELVRQATTAMRDAQARGRTWSVFDDSMHVLAAHQLKTEQGLREALAKDQLVVHYQPIVETETGRLLGAEALVRWNHPQRGMVPPLEFIGVAERTGQIGAIGRLVLRRACAQAVRWAPAGGPFTMSVNVAAEQLLDDGFADMVRSVLAETGLEPGRLCLEVTESAVIRRVGSGAENLHRLRALGVNIAVDDFGTGYSSLSYLKNLPITSLKIDRSFITRIEHDDRDRHLVEAVLGMARALGLGVVAEGVETAGQRRLLEDLGCESAQGYLFGRPCRTEDFSALVQDLATVAPGV